MLTIKPKNIMTPSFHRGAFIETLDDLASVWGRSAPRRVDLYRSRSGMAQIGCGWEDGSTFITDASDWTALTVWISKQIDAGRVRTSEVFQHHQ